MSDKIISQLRAENVRLKGEIAFLKEQLAFHDRHSRTQTGKDGEHFLRELLGGEFSVHNAGHDLVVGERRFEIKASGLASADNKKKLSTNRWTWHRVFGNGGNKLYDRLILLGKVDMRHQDKYKDPESPYVIFDIPGDKVKPFLSGTKNPFINVTTNPISQRSKKGASLWTFQITRLELKRRYSLNPRKPR